MHGVIKCHNHHLQCAKGIKESIAKHGKGFQVATHQTISEDEGKLSKKNEDGTQTLVLCGHVFSFQDPFSSIYCFRECHVFLPMPRFSILLSLQYLRCEKVAACRSSQVTVSQTGVHLSICNL